MLRMLFVCCDPDIPWESGLVLALKTLCGFSTAEIALRLFTSEANVHKRLGRARDRLRQTLPDVELPPLQELGTRLAGVHAVLYLLFNEGYLSAHAEQTIRRELCDEAVRLATLLAEHPIGAVPESFALLALMHLHLARLGSRVDATGGLLLLEEQACSGWKDPRPETCSLGSTRKPVSPPSTALPHPTRRRDGRRSLTFMQCSSEEPPHRYIP
jgi:RNA polymerase sigma-70 factor (ECF subfamily)